ncbi:MAG: hypothetical protein J5896_01355 [Alphaproteobacteria bacterium]|nr:hypothetical protein [Alphaproteobacteria bacterium]
MNIFNQNKFPWLKENKPETEPNGNLRQIYAAQLDNPIYSTLSKERLLDALDTSGMTLKEEIGARYDILNNSQKPIKTAQILPLEQTSDMDENKQPENPYIFSKKMRNLLGELESGNDHRKINTNGGGIGALGKYQIRRDGFKDAGYINNDNHWSGKNNIYSADDYLNSETLQEQSLDDFMQSKYKQLQNNGSYKYFGYPIRGIVDNFNITDTGLLAASHREGAGAVHNYLSHLEKGEDGRYYINYDQISDPKTQEMFKRIETRLRRFEK